ncbi:hypothetical protein QBC43DRAFT_374958 [Cladorrhinum sp. PSN259]|nr:hypothetical protein QBC43DRAFT_374958 [Cladorrhinum sp. PSN259]
MVASWTGKWIVTVGPRASLATAIDDQEILDDIDGRMHGPMSGFIKKYFGNFQYVRQDASMETQAPSPDKFLQWFSKHVSGERDGAQGSWHIESADGGARLFLTRSTSPAFNDKTRWDHVHVVGQFYEHGSVCYRNGLLRLCRSAHEVFFSQPTRLFVHGFYIRGSLIEFWVFDRSGLYCSDVFNIQEDFVRFLTVIDQYWRMTDQDLGENSIIGTDKEGSYVTLNDGATFSLPKLYLENQPIASREGIVGNATTCYRARLPDSDQWTYVVKFKWRWARERPEDELLRLAKEKNVWGAVSLDYYKELDSTANLRRSLRWRTHKKFTKTPSPEINDSADEQRHRLADYTEDTDNFFQNRILACIVTSPVGRPLHTFRSLTELLEAFRDAIKCHRSLFKDADILHQDISPGNTIILDGQEGGKPKGMLIDLDSAIVLADSEEEEGTTESGRIIGTKPFMAIGVLNGEHHTCRHDLESFHYVFLWTIVTNDAEDPPETSKLRQWSNGGWGELAVLSFPEPLAERLRQVLFPLRDGALWTGTDGSPEAVDKLYDEMIRAFEEAIGSEGKI